MSKKPREISKNQHNDIIGSPVDKSSTLRKKNLILQNTPSKTLSLSQKPQTATAKSEPKVAVSCTIKTTPKIVLKPEKLSVINLMNPQPLNLQNQTNKLKNNITIETTESESFHSEFFKTPMNKHKFYFTKTPKTINQEVSSKITPFDEQLKSLGLGSNQSVPISMNNLKFQDSSFQTSKHSTKPIDMIRSYAANTNQGIVRYSQLI